MLITKLDENSFSLNVKTNCVISFDYNTNQHGQFKLYHNNVVIECHPIQTTILKTKYYHVEWLLEAHKEYTLKIVCDTQNVSIQNGWLYDDSLLERGGICFSLKHGKCLSCHSHDN
ncbi:hypothetical protein [Francisella orientalis]|uniref:hypothetical protein n=1 Tax=Francisella orientalis TaxID=299583 RepID=UPI0002D4F83F|nr:hypothetical protein [Francisella orientalis]